MASKSDILNNLREYTSAEIAEAINAGVITMYELSKSGHLTPLMRRRIEEKLADIPSEITQTESSVVYETASTSEKEEPSADASSNEEVLIPEDFDIDFHKETDTPLSLDISNTSSQTDEALEEYLEIKEEEPTSISNKGMLKRPFSFNGRIRRTEYGISFIIYFIWYIITNTMSESSYISDSEYFTIGIISIPMLWFTYAQGAKRCHDRGHSGWYQLIPFYVFVLLFGKGEDGENEYGDNPKE